MIREITVISNKNEKTNYARKISLLLSFALPINTSMQSV